MNTSILENQENYRPLLFNYKRTKNIPIDQEYLISSLDNVDNEIRISTRYPGQPFYSIKEDKMYYFNNDLNIQSFPVDKFVIVNIPQTNNVYDYSLLSSILDDLKVSDLTLVCVKPLNIILLYDGETWSYYSGIYKVSNQEEWNSLDILYKETNKYVLFAGNTKIIKSNGELSDEVIIVTELPSSPENNRYYKYSGNLYYSISGELYKLTSDDYNTYSVVTNIGKHPFYNDSKKYAEESNVITHSLNIQNLMVEVKLNTSNPENTDTYIHPIFKILDNNRIMIYSNIILTNCIVYVKKL